MTRQTVMEPNYFAERQLRMLRSCTLPFTAGKKKKLSLSIGVILLATLVKLCFMCCQKKMAQSLKAFCNKSSTATHPILHVITWQCEEFCTCTDNSRVREDSAFAEAITLVYHTSTFLPEPELYRCWTRPACPAAYPWGTSDHC